MNKGPEGRKKKIYQGKHPTDIKIIVRNTECYNIRVVILITRVK